MKLYIAHLCIVSLGQWLKAVSTCFDRTEQQSPYLHHVKQASQRLDKVMADRLEARGLSSVGLLDGLYTQVIAVETSTCHQGGWEQGRGKEGGREGDYVRDDLESWGGIR